LFIFCLPWQTIFLLRETFIENEKFQYASFGIYSFEIILLLWIILNLFRFDLDKFKRYFSKKNILAGIIFLFLLWSFLSTLWSDDKYLSFYFSLKLFLGAMMFYLIQNHSFNIKKIAGIFLLSSFLQSILGIGQFIFQSSFSSKILGFSAHPAWQGGTSVLQNDLGRWLRAYGGMPHPNILGGFLAISLILGIFLYWKMENEKKISRILVLIALALNFTALLATFSRSALLGFLLGFLSIIAYSVLKKQKIFFRKMFSIFSVFGAIFIIFFASYSEIIFSRLSDKSRLENKSLNERVEQISEARSIIKRNFLLGVGAGNYTVNLYHNDLKNTPVWKHQPVHNTFLLIFSELGIVGIFIFMAILFLSFRSIGEVFNKNKTDRIFFLSIFAIISISFLFDHWLWTSSSGLLLFWLLLGLYKE
jgi:O-antigen ligase